MIKFVKIKDPQNGYDSTDIIMRTDAIGLPEIVKDFEDFLRACGYRFEGELDFVSEDDSE